MKQPCRLFMGLLILATLRGAAVSQAAESESKFYVQVRAWSDRQKPMLEQANSLALSGDVSGANKILISEADKDAGPIASFVVANMLYTSDRTSSYRLHEKTFKAFPKEPGVALEMAMEQHRKGEYEAAVANYKTFLNADKESHYSCLLADCLLRVGHYREACEAWRSAHHPNNHTSIDFAIYEIYGASSPIKRRSDLIKQVKAGDLDKLGDLIELDIHFDRDWWNSSVFKQGLDLDLKLAAEKLGMQDERYRQLELYAKLARDEDATADTIRQALTAAKLVVGPGAVLPANSRLSRALLELVISSKAETPEKLWAMHQSVLRSRLDRHDRDALHALCILSIEAKNGELEPLVTIGWKTWHDTEFAESYMIALSERKKLKADDDELKKALDALPESNVLNGMRLYLAGETRLTKEIVIGAIKAEYRKLSSGMIIPDSYTLNGLFYELEKKL